VIPFQDRLLLNYTKNDTSFVQLYEKSLTFAAVFYLIIKKKEHEKDYTFLSDAGVHNGSHGSATRTD
jgi:hypothetical protein